MNFNEVAHFEGMDPLCALFAVDPEEGFCLYLLDIQCFLSFVNTF